MNEPLHLAQLNIAVPRFPLSDPRIAPFVDALDRVNAIAERSDGFVWRLKGDGHGPSDHLLPGEPDAIVNMSVWRDLDSLQRFVFTTVHRRFFDRKADWFAPREAPDFVMWWVPAGSRPTLEEAADRLAYRRINGSTDRAFGWDHISPKRWLGEVVDG